MGGLVWAENWYESCLTRIYKDICIKTEVHKKYDPFGIFHGNKDEKSCD